MRKTRETHTVFSVLHPNTLTANKGYYTQSLAVLHVCLELGMSADYRPYINETLLTLAVYYHRRERVQLLIKYRADVNCCHGKPIRHAAWKNDLYVTDTLINAGADVNLHGTCMSAITRALTYASLPVVSRLLQAGSGLPDDAVLLARNSNVDSAEKVAFLNARQETTANSHAADSTIKGI